MPVKGLPIYKMPFSHGMASSAGGASAAIIWANVHWTRVLADGGKFPEGNTQTDYNNLLSAISSLLSIYSTTDLARQLAVCIDPHIFGYKLGTGVGATLGRAAQKAYSLMGASSDVVQTTAASQPLLLEWNEADGNYFYNPRSTADNYISTPDTPDNNIVGDIDIDSKFEMTEGTSYLVDRRSGTNQWTFSTNVRRLNLIAFLSGAVQSYVSTVTIPSGIIYGRVKRIASTGEITFYTSADGVNWTQLGATVMGVAGNFTTVATSVKLGSTSTVTGGGDAIIYSARIYNGDRDAGGTLINHFQASDYNISTSQNTLTSSTTGEVWTISRSSATTGLKANLTYRTTLMSNATNHFMQSDTFTQGEPLTDYLTEAQLSWTLNALMFSGKLNTSNIGQTGITPNLSAYSGTGTVSFTGEVLNNLQFLSVVRESGNGDLKLNNGTSDTGIIGPAQPDGVTLFSQLGGASSFVNAIINTYIQAKQADSEAIRTAIYNLTRSWNGF